MKRALITGISGQDGSYLAEYLLSLGYTVFGLARREPESLRWLEPILDRIELISGDLRSPASLEVAFEKAWPDEVYNLAGQVFVPTSWEIPDETFDINVGGLSRLLRLIEQRKPETRLYQASSSAMFGNVDGLCNEDTPLAPTSPYGVSKMAAHRLLEVYRSRKLFAVGGILFNHESPRRGPEMVTRKITRAAAGWATGDRTRLRLGNLASRRDWGFAGDYVRAMHAMLQQPTPRDYVIATGESHSVEEFLLLVLGLLHGLPDHREAAALIADCVEADPRLLRSGEIHDLRGDARLARSDLSWTPSVDFPALVHMMLASDVAAAGGRLPAVGGKIAT
ncbi:MAG TPA: GDP-mannose 4,6-dehydratase [Methylomirabilota bacterium]|jgi:GDPmannose 4,6-dehydratase